MEVFCRSLLAAIPDPRGRKGRRHPLAAMLAAIVRGLLTGARLYRAIAQWTRTQGDFVWDWLGFTSHGRAAVRDQQPLSPTRRRRLVVEPLAIPLEHRESALGTRRHVR